MRYKTIELWYSDNFKFSSIQTNYELWVHDVPAQTPIVGVYARDISGPRRGVILLVLSENSPFFNYSIMRSASHTTATKFINHSTTTATSIARYLLNDPSIPHHRRSETFITFHLMLEYLGI